MWWGWRGSKPGGTASLYIHLHALSAAGEWSVRSPICSAAHIISWLVSEPAPRRGGSRAQRGEGRMLPSPRTITCRQAGEPERILPLAGAVGSTQGTERAVGGGRGRFLWGSGMLLCSRLPLGNVRGTGHLLAHHGCWPHFNFAPGQQKCP